MQAGVELVHDDEATLQHLGEQIGETGQKDLRPAAFVLWRHAPRLLSSTHQTDPAAILDLDNPSLSVPCSALLEVTLRHWRGGKHLSSYVRRVENS